MDLQVLGALLLDDPNDVEPGEQDLLKDTYALVDFLGKLLLNEDSDLVSKIEDGSLSQETFESYCQIWCMDNQAALLSDWSDTRIPSLKITPLMTSPRSS